MSILTALKNIFSSDTASRHESKLSFYQLHTKLTAWKERKVYPYAYELPDKIFLTDTFWTQVIKLYKSTRSDEMERAISVFWADGELVLSSAIKGNRKSVTPSSNIVVKYIVNQAKKEYYSREIYVDNKKRSSKQVYHKKIPKKISVNYLFNMHTHPPHYNSDNQAFYSFFSAQDIKSLLSSGSTITGMIGDKLWILFRTAQTPSTAPNLTDANLSQQELWEKYKIVCYKADFKQTLRKCIPTNSGNN
jgi:hypothetical protein